MHPAPERFPHRGKLFSTVWKKRAGFFHTVEKSGKYFPCCGKTVLGMVLAGAAVGALAGCASVKAGRLAVPKTVHWRATASESAEGHGPELAIDGDTNTWWRSGSTEPQWLQVDLARPAMVCGFSLQWHAPHATEFAVLTSRDGVHWALGHETTGGDGDWDQASFPPVLARHVRVMVEKGLQGSGAALAALEIRGLADQPQARVDGVSVPEACALLDGDTATAWHCPKPAAVVELDLRTPKPVGSVRVDWGAAGYASNVVVEVSTNETDWISAGRIQSRAGTFDVLMGADVRPARYVRLAFSGASGENGFEVAGITLRGAEGAARPWSLYELAASQAPDGVYPDVFRRQQTYWAVAAGSRPGDAEGLLDEWGVFAPAASGPVVAPLILADGEAWTAKRAAAVEHRLGGEGAPLPETTWTLPSGLKLRIRALASSGAPVATSRAEYELANESIMTQTGRLAWVVRPVRLPPPWAGGGLAPINHLRTAETAGGWRELLADGEPLLAVPDPALPFGAATFADGDAAEHFLRGAAPPDGSATDDNGLASAAWWLDFALEPGARTRMVLAANARATADPLGGAFPWPEAAGADAAADAFDRDWVDAAWTWRAETGGCAPKIARPDAIECLQAQAGWLLGVRELSAAGAGEETEAISLRVAALLRAGQADAARGWIERVAAGIATNGWVPARFRADGEPLPRPGLEGLHAAQGQFAFMVMECHRFTQDTAFLHALYPRMRLALAYLAELRAGLEKTEGRLGEAERDLVEGLLPLSGARPGSPQPVHLYADHYWALLGWKECRAAASVLGLNEDATWADEQYRLLRSAVRRSLRTRMDQMTGDWVPVSAEEDRLDPAAVALLFWPCDETDLVEPHELQSSLDSFYEGYLMRREGAWTGLVPADESQLLVPLAAMGRGDYAREVLYSLLDRRVPPGWQVWAAQAAGDIRQPGQIGPMPDLRAAASFYIAARGLAARETAQELDLFSGAPAEWLQHGGGFQVYGMPTQFGPLDLYGFWKADRMVVQIGGGARPPEGFHVWWPRAIAPERVLANGENLKDFDAQGARLPHDFKGTLEAFFPYKAPWPRDP